MRSTPARAASRVEDALRLGPDGAADPEYGDATIRRRAMSEGDPLSGAALADVLRDARAVVQGTPPQEIGRAHV